MIQIEWSLRVMNGPIAKSALSPFYPQLRTLVGGVARSVRCESQTSNQLHS